jgi:RNA polymerase sigma factor (sigma-70 family)
MRNPCDASLDPIQELETKALCGDDSAFIRLRDLWSEGNYKAKIAYLEVCESRALSGKRDMANIAFKTLLDLSSQGDPAAQTVVCKVIQKRAERTALKLCRDQIMAQDISSEVILKLLHKAGDHKTTNHKTRNLSGLIELFKNHYMDSPIGALIRCAVNQAIDMIKAQKSYIPEDNFTNYSTHYPSPEDEYVAVKLQEAINGLPSKIREAVDYRFYHDLSYAQMSEYLKIPEKTLTSRVNNGLERLRKLFGKPRGGLS